MTSFAGAGGLKLYAESLKGGKALNDNPVTDEQGGASGCRPIRQ